MNEVIDEVIDEVINAYGSVSKIQTRFGYTEPMGVYNWRARGIPRSFIADIFVDTKIPIKRLKMAVKTKRAA